MQNDFLVVVQAAFAKTTKILLNLKTMSGEDISEIMKVRFFDYENWKEKRRVEGAKYTWKKNYVPRLGSKFWRNVFKYMLNKDSIIEDVELFVAYPDKDCIRDYWNMAETYAAKVSRRLLYGPIEFRKKIYLRPTILDNHFRSNILVTRYFPGQIRSPALDQQEMEVPEQREQHGE